MIPVFRPSMGREEIDAVAEVIQSGWIGLGPKTAEFEKRFAQYIGTDWSVGVNSCTAALDLALKLLGINHGDEVLIPTMTFVSTGHVVAYNLATPIFVDVDPVTLAIDLDDLQKKITAKTRAIIPVHFGGRPIDMDALQEVAGGIPVIEDAAHATGAVYKGRRVGSLAEIGCFSFHAVKNLAMGDGGALTLDSESMCQRAKKLRWLGIDKGTWDRVEGDRSYWWQYHVDEVGLKCHMNDIAAAMGLVQLNKLEQMNSRRREICHQYTQAFSEFDFIETPLDDDETFESSWHIYHVKALHRNELATFLQERGIATGVHYTPIHLYSCYGNRPSLPNAEAAYERIITLPVFPDMTDDDVGKVIDSVSAFYSDKLARVGHAKG